MTKVDAIARDLANLVCLALILIYGIVTASRALVHLWREDLAQVATIGKGIGDKPMHTGLAYVRERLAFQPMIFLPQQAVLKLSEGGKLLRLIVPKQCALAVKIAIAATSPSTLGQGEHIWIEVVFRQHPRHIVYIAIIPKRQDAACQVVTALWLVVYPAVEQGYQVGIVVKMIGIVEAAVDGWNALLRLSTIAPQLRHVYLARLIVPPRIPRYDFLAFLANVSHHLWHEARVGELHLVGTNMDVRHVESGTNLIQYVFEYRAALLALHVAPEGSLKCRAMPRHVYLWNQKHLVPLAIIHELARLFQGIVFAFLALHVVWRVELRIVLAFQPPSLIFREMPMEDVNLESAQETYFTLELFHGYEAPAHVVHEAPYPECGPVGDFALWQAGLFVFGNLQLLQGLPSPIHSLRGGGLKQYCLGRNQQMIRLFLEPRALHPVNIPLHHAFPPIRHLATEVALLRHGQER